MGRLRHAAWMVWMVWFAVAAQAQASDADEAVTRGEYERATQLLKGADSTHAKLTKARLWLHTGRYDEAAELAGSLTKAPSDVAQRARVLAARAHLRRGRAARAEQMLQPAAEAGSLEALDWLARAATAQGDHPRAMRYHRALIDAYNDDRIKPGDSRALLGVARAAWGLGAIKDANSAFAEAAAAAPDDVQVQVQWADLFLSKYDAGQAGQSLQQALSVNPNHAQALQRLAELHFEHRFDFAQATELLDKAQLVDPNLPAIHVTRAAMALRDHEMDRVRTFVSKALDINPQDLRALSLLAALHFVTDDPQGFRRAEQKVLKIDPRFSRLYTIVAGHAEWEHRYPELVELADKALRINPEDAYAQATRGLNLLRLGRERQGLHWLHEAWRRDRYNVRVFNTLNLYEDVIEPHYVTYEAGRYRLRVHEDEREVLQPYLAPLLDRGFASMRKRYKITPKGPLWFELYADPEHFSVRTTGLPRIGVQGVCFGNVVTALSPAAGPLNWGQVLWHEQAHVFHIALSNNRVPRWFTEGLAEYETEIARPEWKREDDDALLAALEADALPPIARLNHAFTHAESPQEVMVAYYASSRVVAFIVERYGFDAVVQLLKLWGRGASASQAFEQAMGVDLADLDAQFRAYTLERLAPLRAQFRVREASYASLSEWRRREQETPNADNQAGLAAALLLHGELADAAGRAKRIVREHPQHPLALWVIAEACFRAGKLAEAKRALDTLLSAGVDGYGLRMLAARIALKSDDMTGARKQLERAVELSPDQPEAYAALSAVADKTRDLALRTDATLALARIDQHSAGPLRMALPLLSDAKRWQELEELAESGHYVLPGSSLLHRFWARARLEQGRAREAVTPAERAVKLASGPEEQASALLVRARVRAAVGRHAEARKDAARAVELVPALQDAAESLLSR